MSGILKLLNTSNEEQWLTKQLDVYLVANNTARTSKAVFHPSVLSNACDRYLYLHYNGLLPLQDISAQLKRIFDHGNVTQDRYQRYFENMRILRQTEAPAKLTNPLISGRADFIIWHKEKNANYVIELKTINKAGFKELAAARDDHSTQLQIYLNLLGIAEGGVLYECKDDQQIKLFNILRSDEKWAAIVERCFRIMNMKKLPDTLQENHSKYCECLNVANK